MPDAPHALEILHLRIRTPGDDGGRETARSAARDCRVARLMKRFVMEADNPSSC